MRDYGELVKRLKESDDNCHAECYECPGECLSSGCNIFSEAADAIEELLAEKAKIENSGKLLAAAFERLKSKVPRWISVEERLPDVAEKVITYNGDFVSENWMCSTADKNGIRRIWAYSEEFVTHWMPLPAPPKEDDNG